MSARSFRRHPTALRRTPLLRPQPLSLAIAATLASTCATTAQAQPEELEPFFGAGIRVMVMALPDLTRYRITSGATDAIEDAVIWLAAQPGYAADGNGYGHCGDIGRPAGRPHAEAA